MGKVTHTIISTAEFSQLSQGTPLASLILDAICIGGTLTSHYLLVSLSDPVRTGGRADTFEKK